MHLTKDMEHVNLCGILWYIHLYDVIIIILMLCYESVMYYLFINFTTFYT